MVLQNLNDQTYTPRFGKLKKFHFLYLFIFRRYICDRQQKVLIDQCRNKIYMSLAFATF